MPSTEQRVKARHQFSTVAPMAQFPSEFNDFQIQKFVELILDTCRSDAQIMTQVAMLNAMMQFEGLMSIT